MANIELLLQNLELPYYPNILLIAGAGRNVGKTTLACKIISHLSKHNKVTAVKISQHMHDDIIKNEVVVLTKNYTVIKENNNSNKDSSRMLKAGAEQVFYIQVKQAYLKEAIQALLPFIKDKPVVTESGGLHQIIKPGIFMFVHRENNIPDNKKAHLQYNPILVDVFNASKDFKIQNIRFVKEGFIYKTE